MDISAKLHWDEELFIAQMGHLRGWQKEKAYQHWRKLEQDSTVKRDNLGLGALRLVIPSQCTGTGKEEERRGNFEERHVENATKSSKVDQETVQKWISDTGSGFNESYMTLGSGSSGSADLRTEMSAALPGSSAGEPWNSQASRASFILWV